jgi:hypothetical protein
MNVAQRIRASSANDASCVPLVRVAELPVHCVLPSAQHGFKRSGREKVHAPAIDDGELAVA